MYYDETEEEETLSSMDKRDVSDFLRTSYEFENSEPIK